MLKLAGGEVSISTAVQDLISSCRAEPESDSRIESVVEAGHRQQCNATTYMLLTAFWCKNFAITIFTWGSLWVETLFFLLLFVRNCRFPRCSNSKLSLSIPSFVQSKKVGRDMSTHLRRRSYAPRQAAPLGPSHFLSKTLSRPALEVNRSYPKIAGQDAHYGITSQYHWVSKKHQKQLPSFMLRAAQGRKVAKKSLGLRLRRTGREQEHLLLRLRRASSRSLVLRVQPCAFSSAIYSCLGDLATCFTCLHQSKQAKKSPRGVRTMAHGPGLQTCMQPVLHAAHAMPACITCMHSSTRSTQITGMVTSIVVFRFAQTPPPLSLVKRILFLLFWERRRNRQIFAILLAASSSRRSTKHTSDRQCSEGGGTVSAVDYEWNR